MNIKLNSLALIVACSAPQLALASADHSPNFAGKSFYLYQPAFNHCLAYAATVGKVTCNDSAPSRAISLFQFDHGKLRLIAPNSTVANSTSAPANLCLQIPSTGNQMSASTCADYPNHREVQTFKFIQATGTAKGRYYIKSPYAENKCVTYSASTGRFDYLTCNNKAEQLFEVTHTKDPIHIRMTNKAWLNLSFYVETKNENNQISFNKSTPWAALDNTRHILHPVSGFSERDDFEKIIVKDDTGNTLVLPNAMPGSIYTVEAHGTAFNTSLRYSLKTGSEQIELFEREYYTGDRHLFSESQPNLLFLNTKLRSVRIPTDWSVRFYEGANYTGNYYTRNGGATLDANTLSKIHSFEVLSKPDVVSLHESSYHESDSFSFNQSQPTLLNFNNQMSSFKIPDGWEVRFYEGENFTGKYYTRNKTMAMDYNLTNKIRSFEILNRPFISISEELYLYDDYNYSGYSVSFSENQPNLGGFNRRLSSFSLPEGWKVRFYEGANYTGKYYTRDSSEARTSAFDNKITSFEILEK